MTSITQEKAPCTKAPVQTAESFNLKRISKLEVIATDAEWDGRTGRPLLVQFYHRNTGQATFYMCHSLYSTIGNPVTRWSMATGVNVEPVEFGGDVNLLERFIKSLEISPKRQIELLMFYSPKDLEFACGWETVNPMILDKRIQQKRNISGRRVDLAGETSKVTIKDLKGWQPDGGLSKLAESVGVEMTDKGAMDVYKSRMADGFIEKPEDALNYSLGDVRDLTRIYEKFQTEIESIAKETLGVSIDFELPGTTGALVARIFETWLWKNQPDVNPEKLAFAYRKLGVLNTSAKAYRPARDAWNNVTHAVRNFETDYLNVDVRQRKLFERADYQFFGYSQASVQAQGLSEDSSAFNALVQGGRCNNERPNEYRLGVGADIDLNSCYGSALTQFTYALGLPTNYGFRANEPRPTLGVWMAKNERELVDGLWTLTVSSTGKHPSLGLAQDLIYSKIVTLEEVQKAAHGNFEKETCDADRDDDLAHMPGDFALIRRQIENGVITSEVWKVIKAVATSQEVKALSTRLEVVAASVYRASDRVESLDEWTALVIADKGRHGSKSGKSGDIQDHRTRAWYGVPLNGFIGNLVTERKRIKALKKTDASYAARDKMLKLFINTLYGVMASVYFPVGSTVLANNITAKARVGAWMLNKALHTRQSITDGGFYGLNAIPYLDNSLADFKLPGLEKLATFENWRRCGCKFKPLGDTTNWDVRLQAVSGNKDAAKALAAELDHLAQDHISEFWGNYGLSLPFEIEHKEENTYLRAAYLNKAHYAFDTVLGTREYKIRGTKQYDGDKAHLKESPLYSLFDAVLDGTDEFPADLGYHHWYLLKMKEYSLAAQSRGYEYLDSKRPGDDIVRVRTARFNNLHVPINTITEYQRRTSRKTKARGKETQWFERYGELGVKRVVTEMAKEAR